MSKPIKENNPDFLLYTTESGEVKVDVLIQKETIWLTMNQMANLFGIDKSGISRHIKNIFETGELQEEVVVAKIANTAPHGAMAEKTQTRTVMYFNLDMIISVGYRVNSIRATHFRIWASKQLKELIIKGFVLNNQKLKDPDNPLGKDYFDELLEQIRDICSSEKRFYQKITDIYALAVDYDPKTEDTQDFFRTVQNKLIFAATQHTAAEIIAQRSDATQEKIGLKVWQGEKVRKKDVTISKNYLDKEELDTLNRMVSMYLDFAELHAKNHRQMFMTNWRAKLDAFLTFNDQEILQNAGSIAKKVADQLAMEQYDAFHSNRLRQAQDAIDDIDIALKEIKDE